MNSLTRIMSYDKTKINQECNCNKCTNIEVENQTVEYPKLSEEEIEQIISKRYFNKDEKTKTFIRKALRKHGDMYDYSNVVYVKATVNVEIICRVEGHEPFPQTPDVHLSGSGCKICGRIKSINKQKLTLKEFIEKANEVHGKGKYDYSESEYINMNTPILIICPNHKPFKQTPANHLNGQGCPICGIKKCADKRRTTIEEFIKRANIVHGEGRYDYSKVNYVDNQTEVIIICHNHETPYEFPQTPSNHLSGNGCKLCGIKKRADERRMTKEEFVEQANSIYGLGTYNYSKVNYVNTHTEVIIICPKHGDFPQEPASHLQGHGCRKCYDEKLSLNQRMSVEEFIEKSNEIHGVGTYDYSKVNYVNMHTIVTITCSIHGDFPQIPQNHINGSNCPKCTNKYKGEIIIRNFLIKNKIEFEEQKKFENCRNINLLSFDFHLPQYNLCIEFDGLQHFEKVNWSGKMTDIQMEENLRMNKLRDDIKNKYCILNNINLLRIRYDENIEEKLSEYFQKIQKNKFI